MKTEAEGPSETSQTYTRVPWGSVVVKAQCYKTGGTSSKPDNVIACFQFT
jgi:hypothetical protein